MSWRDDLRPASFRGVPFGVEGSDTGHGRRVVVHEYPHREKPYAEDLGRAARTFEIEGFVLGDDYLARLEELITACETEGPGQLVHPYRGTRSVVCRALRVQERSTEGRMARVRIQFSEAGAPAIPEETRDVRVDVDAAGEALAAAAAADFEARYSLDGLPDYATESTRTLADEMVDAMRAVRDLVDDVTAFDRLLDQVPDFLSEPLGILRSTFDLLSARGRRLAQLIDPAAILALLDVARGAAAPSVTGETDDRIRERENGRALADLITRLAVAELAGLAARAGWESYEEAEEARAAVDEMLEEQSGDTGDDEVYRSLQDLRAELARAVPGADQLPRLTTVELPATTPALVLAHRLYGDPARGDEIARRNRVPHPGFLPGGTPLEVLTDG